MPPPPPPAAVPAPLLRLSAPVPQVRDTNSIPTLSLQDLLQPSKPDSRSHKRKKRGKKLLMTVVMLGMLAGGADHFRSAAPIQKLLGHQQQAAPLPDVPFVRPSITTAEYSVTSSAVQNGVPNNVTTKVIADYINGTGQSTVENQTGGAFTSSAEIRTRVSSSSVPVTPSVRRGHDSRAKYPRRRVPTMRPSSSR